MRKLVTACLLLASGVALGQQAAAGQAAAGKTDAQRAVAAVLRHYTPNSKVSIPETGKPLDSKGSWTVSLARPDICPADAVDPCVRLHYKEPGTTVDCTWVVLLKPEANNAEILDQNADVDKYLTRKMTSEEAKSLILHTEIPIYPPIAEAAHVDGTWEVTFTVAADGRAQAYFSPGGPLMLRGTIQITADHWTFAPLHVGVRAIPYEVRVKFTGRANGVGTGAFTVETE